MIELLFENGEFSFLNEREIHVRRCHQVTCDIEIKVKDQVEESKKNWLLDEARKFINKFLGTSYQNIGMGSGINTESVQITVITHINTRLY